MRKASFLPALLLTSVSFVFSQANADQQGTTAAPGSTPAPQQSAQPQKQMPFTQAPPPRTSSEPSGQAQTISAAGTTARNISAGTTIRANLDTPLSTRTSKIGDRFTATVTAPVQDAAGNIIVPMGSKVNGQITEPSNEKLASAIKGMGHLNLRFTNIQLANGTDIPINATLLSVHRASMRTPGEANPQTASNAIGANTALSRAFGPPMKGVAVGNFTGGGYVLSTTGKQIDLPADCGLRLRVDRETPLP
jgi:hypothetical protein